MHVEFETNERLFRECVPPRWQRVVWALSFVRLVASALGASLLLWALGLRGAVAGGWIVIGVVSALVAWRWRQRNAAATSDWSHRVTLAMQPHGVEWQWHDLKQLRYDWRWFRRAGHTDEGFALEVADRSGYVIAPRSAFRSADDFRQACELIDMQMLSAAQAGEPSFGAAKIERRLPLRSDIGQILFRDTNPHPQVAPPQVNKRLWFWSLLVAAFTLLAWALPGNWQTIVGTLAMLGIVFLAVSVMNWLGNRRAVAFVPPSGEEFFIVTDLGCYHGNRMSDEFVSWSNVAEVRSSGSVLDFFNDQGQWISAVDLGRLSTPAAADEFADLAFANVQGDEPHDDVVDEDSFDDGDSFDDEIDDWHENGEVEEPIDGSPQPTAPPSTTDRILRVCAYLAPLVFFALGIWGNWPHIELEHRRMEFWRVPVFWMSEMTALFWYLVYGVGLLMGKTRPRGVGWWVWATFAAGFGMDLGITLSERRDEHQAFARSEVSQAAQATSAKLWTHRGEQHLERLDCEFTDQQGVKHSATFDLINTKFPDEVEQAASKGKFPLPLEIRYDPERPERHWLAATKEPHYNRLYIVGASVILFSTLLGMLFLLLRRDHHNVLPAEAAPFLAASFVLGFVGTLRVLFASFS